MPISKTKIDLLSATEGEYRKLDTLLARVDAEHGTQPCPEGPCIKDIVGHRAYWVGLFLGWVADARAGDPVHLPADGYNWNELKDLSAHIRDEQRGLDWAAVRALLANRHARLMGLLNGMSEDELYGTVMPGQTKWTVGRYAEAAGASHYRSAAKYIRACLRSVQSDEGALVSS